MRAISAALSTEACSDEQAGRAHTRDFFFCANRFFRPELKLPAVAECGVRRELAAVRSKVAVSGKLVQTKAQRRALAALHT